METSHKESITRAEEIREAQESMRRTGEIERGVKDGRVEPSDS